MKAIREVFHQLNVMMKPIKLHQHDNVSMYYSHANHFSLAYISVIQISHTLVSKAESKAVIQ